MTGCAALDSPHQPATFMPMATDAALPPNTPEPLTPPPPGGVLVWRFIRRYAKRYLGLYALGIGFLLATNGLTVLIPRLIKEVFDGLGEGHADVNSYARLIGVAALGVIVVRTLSRVLFFNPGRTIEFRVRNDMLRKLLAMSTTFFGRVGIGDLVSRAINDATYVRSIVGFAVLNLLNLAMATTMAIWQMLEIDPWLTLWCCLPLIASTWIMRVGISWMYTRMRAAQEELGQLSTHILQSYGGVAVISASGAQPAFTTKFDALNARYTDLSLQVAAVRCFVMPVARAVGSVCVFLLLWIGGQHTLAGDLTVGDLAAYASFVGMLVSALAMAGWLLNALQRGYVSLQRVWQVLQLSSDRPAGLVALPTTDEGVAVQVSGLSFGYAPGSTVLTDVSLDLAPGKTLGVYGPVGSGKSTLIRLISGLLSPTPGTVTLDGVDVADIAPASFRRDVAVVPQESFLFSRSLRDNIAFAEKADTIDELRVAQVTEQAALGDDISRLDDGLMTLVGERGLMLSGGQRQRAQIARALYTDARLMILDDVLSAVDHDTERRLLDALRAHRKAGASTIIVSSRLSALVDCDEIIVLDEGRITQRGDHDALVAEGGLYAAAWAVQRESKGSPP
ncbi:MAG: ABC transporter ATP-binding protein [Myxococcales bacterium]|nr:ABC transporter ATP-binding protein [Myxococcales bacterium]